MVDKAKANGGSRLNGATVAFRLSDARRLHRGRAGPARDRAWASSSPSSGRPDAGKSTLLNVAAGLLRPSSGNGADFRIRRLRASTGKPAICFRPMRCFPGKTAIDNCRHWPRGYPAMPARPGAGNAPQSLAHVGRSCGVRQPLSAICCPAASAKRVGLAQVLITAIPRSC